MKRFKAKLINGVTIRNIKAKDEYFAARFANQYGSVQSVKEHSSYWWLIYPALIGLGLFAFYQVA